MSIPISKQKLEGGTAHTPCGVTGGGGAGGRVPPDIFHREIFRKKGGKRERENGEEKKKMERKRRQFWKGRGRKFNMEGERYVNEQRTFFTFFLILWNLFGSTKMDNFYLENHILRREKIRKLTLPPLKIFLLRHWPTPKLSMCLRNLKIINTFFKKNKK